MVEFRCYYRYRCHTFAEWALRSRKSSTKTVHIAQVSECVRFCSLVRVSVWQTDSQSTHLIMQREFENPTSKTKKTPHQNPYTRSRRKDTAAAVWENKPTHTLLHVQISWIYFVKCFYHVFVCFRFGFLLFFSFHYYYFLYF